MAMLPQFRNALITIWILLAFATIFLGLRIYCKKWKHTSLRRDDWVLIASWVMLLLSTILNTYKENLHAADYFTNLDTITMVQQITTTFQITSQSWSKISFALTLLQIADGWVRVFLWLAIASIHIAFGLGGLFNWIGCSPLQKVWKPMTPGTCWDPWINIKLVIFIGVFSGTMDFCFALIPWKILWGLQMKRSEKFGIAIAMSAGIAAGICSFIRGFHFRVLSESENADWSQFMIWASAEPAVTIIAASIPTLRVLLKHIARSHISQTKRSGDIHLSGIKDTIYSHRTRPVHRTDDNESDTAILDDRNIFLPSSSDFSQARGV